MMWRRCCLRPFHKKGRILRETGFASNWRKAADFPFLTTAVRPPKNSPANVAGDDRCERQEPFAACGNGPTGRSGLVAAGLPAFPGARRQYRSRHGSASALITQRRRTRKRDAAGKHASSKQKRRPAIAERRLIYFPSEGFCGLSRVASDSVATSDVYKTYTSEGATNSGRKRPA